MTTTHTLTGKVWIGNTKPLFRPAAATARLHRRPLLARSDGGSPSALAWFIYALLLGGRRTLGWQGIKAGRATVGGFIVVLASYLCILCECPWGDGADAHGDCGGWAEPYDGPDSGAGAPGFF